MKYQRSYTPLSIRRLERKSKNKLIISIILGGILVYALFFWIIPTAIGGVSFFKKSPDSGKQVVISDSTVLAPPVLNIPYESTNTAQIQIKGYASPSVKVEIYLDNSLQTTVTTNSGGDFTSDPVSLDLGNNDITAKTVDNRGNKSLPSKAISITYDNNKPTLTVTSPYDDQTVDNPQIVVSGSTNADGNTVVTVNGIRAVIDSDGNFSQTIQLNAGDNILTIDAQNQAGNVTEVIKKVTYAAVTSAPSPTPITVQ